MNLRREMKKVYKKTKLYRLDQLFKEERKWKRRKTIANNKLEIVRKKISKLCQESVEKEYET